nr:polyprotein [Shamrock chlorotic ringspot virus]
MATLLETFQISFGSFTVSACVNTGTLKPVGSVLAPCANTNFRARHRALSYHCDKLIAERKAELDAAFRDLTPVPPIYSSHKSLGNKKLSKIKPIEDLFEERIITTIQVEPSIMRKSVEESVEKVPLGRSIPNKTPRKVPKVALGAIDLGNLIWKVSKICRNANKEIEIIGKQSLRCCHQRKKNLTHLKVITNHELGKFKNVDVNISEFQATTLERMIPKVVKVSKFKTADFEKGDSGIVILKSSLTGRVSKGQERLFIIRGKCGRTLYNATLRIPTYKIRNMTHYSDTSAKFWKGFEEKFLELKPKNLDHLCTSDYDIEHCGSVAAIVCQAILPCGKITCQQCSVSYAKLSEQDLKSLLVRNCHEKRLHLHEHYPQFKSVEHFLDSIGTKSGPIDEVFQNFSEISRICIDKKSVPFTFVQTINNIMVKGTSVENGELIEATTALRELTRYLNNRTDSIKRGAISAFRNKRSAKAHINTVLMCDNQRDVNGNFVWGTRGYHAKRFFSKYFDTIDPALGYDKYALRSGPNGSRHLAITNLIVSTNLAALRNQLSGIKTNQPLVSMECVSKTEDSFNYPCCCVTHEDGAAVLSDLMEPTKNHLVIGNTGDSKYVRMPPEQSGQMYIVKDGYCYINIFLAMLVNVNESEAKEFTKMARDVGIAKLGKWPSLMDVATVCLLLTIFFPETRNAELPRILVDHVNKTMHVVDAYGSLSTGYHVLKANTISQLTGFASNALVSDMKNYVVGGTSKYDITLRLGITQVIKCIYKPNKLKLLLQEEPYMILFALLSPRVTIEMYRSECFNMLIKQWMHRDQDLAQIGFMLNKLSEKLTTSEHLMDQIEIIEENASDLLDVVFKGSKPYVSYMASIQMLMGLSKSNEANKELKRNGYRNSRYEVVSFIEKIYTLELQDSWRELSYWARCTHIISCTDLLGKFTKLSRTKSIKELEKPRMSYTRCVFTQVQRGIEVQTRNCKATYSRFKNNSRNFLLKKSVCAIRHLVPELLRNINTLCIIAMLLSVLVNVQEIYKNHIECRRIKQENEYNADVDQIYENYNNYIKINAEQPSVEEFTEHLQQTNPLLIPAFNEMILGKVSVEFQAKRDLKIEKLEQIVGFIALIMMIIDSERSDGVFKILSKVKNVIGSQQVRFQSLDDIKEDFDENMSVKIDLEGMTSPALPTAFDRTFGEWWSNQIENGRTIPHYRTEGHFMEFTRSTAAIVALEISRSPHRDILLRGAVGSGKSTGLPNYLAQKGKVLLLEPTRPLAENVHKQLRKAPFFQNATLRMRGLNIFGSSPIAIMTSGFALHYYAHSLTQLEAFDYIIFDECHVMDSSAMAFRCLLNEVNFSGKIIKVSATPPGREAEFETQHKVSLCVEDSLTMQQFVQNLGTGCNSDVLNKGNNILVYVSSYNEVDVLSKLLTERNFKVTKVDGRTMKLGNCEIETNGTDDVKHFIVSTNIIENGVTIDVDVVVDFGMKVVAKLDTDNRLVEYHKESVSYGERIQRLGRVGRNKPGHALRIGSTIKGLVEVPTVVATEAAFYCFAYNLPVMTSGVSTSVLKEATIKQANTMLQFELPIFYMKSLVKFDGSMHPAIHDELKKFKLRESEVILSKSAAPCSEVSNWLSAREYRKLGVRLQIDDKVRVPFYVKEIPEAVHEKLWASVQVSMREFKMCEFTSPNVEKISYVLQTDIHAIPRTVQIIDILIEKELEKHYHFKSAISQSCSSSNFTLSGITHMILSRYKVDHTGENIEKLQRVKNQILEFKNLGSDASTQSLLKNYGALEAVRFQSASELTSALGLKGLWNKSLVTQDVLLLMATAFGSVWMVYDYYSKKFTEKVRFQGYNKRQRQKLKFRQTSDGKHREVFGSDDTIEDHFGSKYIKKGKQKGNTRGMGTKTRRFINMYGFDPADYSYIRFLDPLTGVTLDEMPMTDIGLVQEHFEVVRNEQLLEGELDKQLIMARPQIEGYFVNDAAKKVLKVDLTPHNPLQVCDKSATIAGFPDMSGILRQTGSPLLIPISNLPEKNEVSFETRKNIIRAPITGSTVNFSEEAFQKIKDNLFVYANDQTSWDTIREGLTQISSCKRVNLTLSLKGANPLEKAHDAARQAFQILRKPVLANYVGITADVFKNCSKDFMEGLTHLGIGKIANIVLAAGDSRVSVTSVLILKHGVNAEDFIICESCIAGNITNIHESPRVWQDVFIPIGCHTVISKIADETTEKHSPLNQSLNKLKRFMMGHLSNRTEDCVKFESQSLMKGVTDYNPIAKTVCYLINRSEGHEMKLYGIGYGSFIITNRHLFEHNNGELMIKSHTGEYLIKNTVTLPVYPIDGKDMILIKLPKDFPPFPQKLKFREPISTEKVVMVGSMFQTKCTTSLISEASTTYKVMNSHFWKHWISTKDGYCGFPLVSIKDNCIVGIHSLASETDSCNFFTAFSNDFQSVHANNAESLAWQSHWKLNINMINWGPLEIMQSQPTGLLKADQLIYDLDNTAVQFQGMQSDWVLNSLEGNLKAVAKSHSQLVTKHVVKGKCMLFETYLQTNEAASNYFRPLMGAYGKSKLNREAYIKDFSKYSSVIEIGAVDHNAFERAVEVVINRMTNKGFSECKFVTDADEIFSSMNMKAAVGALYRGKKRERFEGYSSEQMDQALYESSEKTFNCKLGVWNGSLKAELRPMEKILLNKTRTFTAAPIDSLLCGKMCVDDFNNQFYDLNTVCPWSVGMSKFFRGWDRLLRVFPENWIYCDADGSQFDSSLTPYLINSVLKIRLHFMEDWDIGERCLKNLYTEIIYTPILTPDGTIVKKFRGNNSGQPSTVVDNSLMVYIAMEYALTKLGINAETQDEVCKFMINGDDLLIGVAPEYEYVLDNLQAYFSQLGLKYEFTSRTKDKSDLWFMSHRGVTHNGLRIPKLEPERIVSILEWDRATKPEHRLESICASMIEAWGYGELLHEIRKFYQWVLEQQPFSELAKEGKAPYISELALRNLYTEEKATPSELLQYLDMLQEAELSPSYNHHKVRFQGKEDPPEGVLNAGKSNTEKGEEKSTEVAKINPTKEIERQPDRDVNAGSSGIFKVPTIKSITPKMKLPKVEGRIVLNLEHLLEYDPNPEDLYNTRATQTQFESWYNNVRDDYGCSDEEMPIICNGLMVWCLENGVSPNINGVWIMMDGGEQKEFPLKPIVEHARPTLRQIMHHFSNAAEAYIERRNYKRPYMPRYGLIRNLTDFSLARYAFDFYEITSRTPIRAREAHIQMKAAALRSTSNKLFGLDGNIGTTTEDTERHVVDDSNKGMHNLLGVRI